MPIEATENNLPALSRRQPQPRRAVLKVVTSLLPRGSLWPFAAALCLTLSAASIALHFSPHGLLSNQDSWAPMQAALDKLGTPDGSRLYETLFFEQHVKMQYPPTSLLPLGLLDTLGIGSPRLLNILNVGLLLLNAVLLGCLADALLRRSMGPRWLVIACGTISGIAFYPITRALQLGQIQIWLDLCFTAACLLIVHGRPAFAGSVMGLASLIKPQFLPLPLFELLIRQWRFAAGLTAVATCCGALSVSVFGLHNHLEYLEVLHFISQHGESFYSNNSVNGIVNRLLNNGPNLSWNADAFAPFHPAVFAATSAAAALFLAIPCLIRPARGDAGGALAHLCLATLCCILASPVAWEHHYGVLPPMILVALSRIHAAPESGKRRWLTIGVAASWLLSACHLAPVVNKLNGSVLNPVQATHFFGALILSLVLIRSMRPHLLPVASRCLLQARV